MKKQALAACTTAVKMFHAVNNFKFSGDVDLHLQKKRSCTTFIVGIIVVVLSCTVFS